MTLFLVIVLVLGFGAGPAVYAARRWLTRLPAPGATPSATGPAPLPGPAPGHHTGGVHSRVLLFRCGCVHVYDQRGAIIRVTPCTGEDLDEELRRMTS